jgi:hypothetical protein
VSEDLRVLSLISTVPLNHQVYTLCDIAIIVYCLAALSGGVEKAEDMAGMA